MEAENANENDSDLEIMSKNEKMDEGDDCKEETVAQREKEKEVAETPNELKSMRKQQQPKNNVYEDNTMEVMGTTGKPKHATHCAVKLTFAAGNNPVEDHVKSLNQFFKQLARDKRSFIAPCLEIQA